MAGGIFSYIYCRVFLYNFLSEKLQGEKLIKNVSCSKFSNFFPVFISELENILIIKYKISNKPKIK
jgi:hypothetical protein